MNIKSKEDQKSSRLGNLDQYKFRLCLNGKPVLIRFGEEETDVKETIRDILTNSYEEKLQKLFFQGSSKGG